MQWGQGVSTASNQETRIVMWSGPRNISTAMMRSWENRTDCTVLDEPFYACYLDQTGLDHPMRDEVIASQPTAWRDVVETLLRPLPDGIRISYQKHMAHHMSVDIEHDWLDQVQHAFLIRSPEEMVASYAAKRESVAPKDLGLDIQVSIYKEVQSLIGKAPVVLNAADVLQHPEDQLRQLCHALEVPFDAGMLSWPKGSRDSDGVWARHWYHSVEQSTGFAPYEEKSIELSDPLRQVADACRESYEFLNAQRLRS